MLNGELAVPCSPKSAHAGLKILSEKQELRVDSFSKRGGRTSCADDYESRQVREEAAVNNSICITK